MIEPSDDRGAVDPEFTHDRTDLQIAMTALRDLAENAEDETVRIDAVRMLLGLEV